MDDARIVSGWRSSAPYLLAVLRIVTAFLFIQVGSAKLFAFPGAILPNGATAPARAAGRGLEFLLPTDLVVADSLEAPTDVRTVAADAIPDGFRALDIGPETRAAEEVVAGLLALDLTDPLNLRSLLA